MKLIGFGIHFKTDWKAQAVVVLRGWLTTQWHTLFAARASGLDGVVSGTTTECTHLSGCCDTVWDVDAQSLLEIFYWGNIVSPVWGEMVFIGIVCKVSQRKKKKKRSWWYVFAKCLSRDTCSSVRGHVEAVPLDLQMNYLLLISTSWGQKSPLAIMCWRWQPLRGENIRRSAYRI